MASLVWHLWSVTELWCSTGGCSSWWALGLAVWENVPGVLQNHWIWWQFFQVFFMWQSPCWGLLPLHIFRAVVMCLWTVAILTLCTANEAHKSLAAHSWLLLTSWGSTVQNKLFLPQAGIMVSDCKRSSVERKVVFRISTSCSCKSSLTCSLLLWGCKCGAEGNEGSAAQL